MIRKLSGLFCLMSALILCGSAQAQDKTVSTSAPYIEQALSAPIGTLYTKAHEDVNAYNAFTLGLALFAGRGTDGEFTEADEAALIALDERIAPQVEAYIKKHPKDDHGRIDWRKKLKVTNEELAVIGRYQAAYLPEFWLGWAMSQVNIRYATRLARPQMGTHATGGMGAVGVGNTYTLPVKSNIIEWDIYNSAVHCVSAVRQAAGYSIVPLKDQPISTRLLRNYIKFDVQYRVEQDLTPESRYKGLKGAAACGAPEQFDAYVAKLKAAD